MAQVGYVEYTVAHIKLPINFSSKRSNFTCTYAAGAGRGNNHNHPPVCTYPNPPEHDDQRQETRRIAQLLEALDMLRITTADPVVEEEGTGNCELAIPPQLSQVLQLGQSSFVVAELCGRLVFTTWGPRCILPQIAVEGGAAW